MKCPACGQEATRIVDTHALDAGVRRQRRCQHCGNNFATLEHAQATLVMVVKRDGRREPFQREKLLAGLRVSARKRPLAEGALDAIVGDVEQRLAASGRGEVPSRVIGELAISHLKRLDPIAYIRFSSAYRQFVSLDDMLDELSRLAESPLAPAEQGRLFADEASEYLASAKGADGLPRVPTPIASARARS
jgi:transcriptional repressor NrdR